MSLLNNWIPAFAGMTEELDSRLRGNDKSGRMDSCFRRNDKWACG
jgi:hypothetical protein